MSPPRDARTPVFAQSFVLGLGLGLALTVGGCRMQEGEGSAQPDPPPTENRVLSVHPSAYGDVAPIVRSELDKASAKGRRLVVYLGATWCEPCQKFHHAVERGELDSAFPNLTLLEFDADHDSERLRAAGYASHYIPMFALPKPDGTSSGKQVEGGVKGDQAVAVVSGKLKGLLAQN